MERLLGGLDALYDTINFHLPSQFQNGSDRSTTTLVIDNILHESAINFENIDRKAVNSAQAGQSSAEVV